MTEIFTVESMEDLNIIFSKINQSKAIIKDGEVATVEYAKTINELSCITVEDSDLGEEITETALAQLRRIEAGQAARKDLEMYTRELEEKYGIPAKQRLAKAM